MSTLPIYSMFFVLNKKKLECTQIFERIHVRAKELYSVFAIVS